MERKKKIVIGEWELSHTTNLCIPFFATKELFNTLCRTELLSTFAIRIHQDNK